ncbi:Hypothetical predicted protein [Cloeon dipterum]|uniref:C2H2-type domain-containing protein n=1 Tax=Cloeon dipterum TaxID=197152 RepID=A0A8S1E7F5_9INSE|nr:Hypothetical predicted protein [Cloeon dipterum]
MSFARPLCVLCERPTADGAVQAVQLDNEKLQTWLLNIFGHEFAVEIKDEDLICYFCIWHAEFLAKHGLDFQVDSWWPQDLDYLDDAAKELRKSYFDGMVEQSWVQLEQIDESESEEEESESESGTEQKKSKCFYCMKSYRSRRNLTSHVKKAHKHAISSTTLTIHCFEGSRSEMSSARPLCVLCERPTADGAVQAVHVDKEKLHTWLLNICGHEFAEDIEDHDLICYFCTWHAEFLAKPGLNVEADSWWPQDMDYLGDEAKELRKSYFDGKIEQSWVQLEKIDESESEEEETESESGTEPKRRRCFYCKKRFRFSGNLAHHIKNAHKHAIRCENRCPDVLNLLVQWTILPS